MREDKFRKLVHSYLDSEATPKEIAALRAEIVRNPRRRECFRSHLQLHRATRKAFFRLAAEQGERGVAEAPEPRSRSRAPRRRIPTVSIAASAAAACIAVALLVIPQREAPEGVSQSGGQPEMPVSSETEVAREGGGAQRATAARPQADSESTARSGGSFHMIAYPAAGDAVGSETREFGAVGGAEFREERDSRAWDEVYTLMRQPIGLRMQRVSEGDHASQDDGAFAIPLDRSSLWGQSVDSQTNGGVQPAGFNTNPGR